MGRGHRHLGGMGWAMPSRRYNTRASTWRQRKPAAIGGTCRPRSSPMLSKIALLPLPGGIRSTPWG